MTKYSVYNVSSGSVLGEYEAESKGQALDMASRDAGYESFEMACAAMVDRDTYSSDEEREEAMARERADVDAEEIERAE